MHTLPKTLRLVHQRDFDHVFARGRVVSDPILIVHAVWNPDAPTRLGLSVSRRVGCAVIRNRWKRLIREVFRLHRHEFPSHLTLVVRPRKGASPSFDDVANSLLHLIRRIKKPPTSPSRP